MPLSKTSLRYLNPAKSVRLPHWVYLTLIFLSASLLYNWNPFAANTWQELLLPAPEMLLLPVLPSLVKDLRLRNTRWILVALILCWFLLRLYALAEQAMPVFFDRSFNLYIDSAYLPDLLDLLWTSSPGWQFIIGTILLLVSLAALLWLQFRVLRTAMLLLRPRFRRQILRGVLAWLVVGTVWGMLIQQQPGPLFSAGYLPALKSDVLFINNIRQIESDFRGELTWVQQRAAQQPADLGRLQGANVLLVFVESYGYSSLNHPDLLPYARPVLETFQQGTREHGFYAASNYLRAPTYGGTSWLSHATLSSGVLVHDQLRFDLLLESQVKTLARYFNDAGYRSLCIMPGTRYAWPEGKFFGYRDKWFADNFGYAGEAYGWSTMPDQFVLDRVRRQFLQMTDQPVFAEYVLISSHAPFHIQPPYVDDWETIGDGTIYRDLEVIRYPITWPDLTGAAEGYMRSISYVLQCLQVYLERYVDDNTLVIILGDHQPNMAITGLNQPWSVPIHVLSRNREFVEVFERRGYTSGMWPQQLQPHTGMEQFLGQFLQDFSLQGTAN